MAHQDRLIQTATELPKPIRGVTSRVFTEILSDRSKFAIRELKQMGTENRILQEWLVEECMISATRELSLDWALGYYTIHSRSARQRQMTMPVVTEELIRAEYSQLGQVAESLSRAGQEEKVSEYMLEQMEQRKSALYARDTQSSPELFRFWSRALIFNFTHQLSQNRFSPEAEMRFVPSKPNDVLFPLFTLGTFLHQQTEINRLNAQFPQG